MPFLPPNQQRQSTEGKALKALMLETHNKIIHIYVYNWPCLQPFGTVSWVSRRAYGM